MATHSVSQPAADRVADCLSPDARDVLYGLASWCRCAASPVAHDGLDRPQICQTRRAAPGDILIIATFAAYNELELAKHEPELIYVDSQNRITRRGHKIPVQAAA